MTDKKWKGLYKFCIDHGYEKLSSVQKGLLKKAIDEAKTFDELLVTAIAAIETNDRRKS